MGLIIISYFRLLTFWCCPRLIYINPNMILRLLSSKEPFFTTDYLLLGTLIGHMQKRPQSGLGSMQWRNIVLFNIQFNIGFSIGINIWFNIGFNIGCNIQFNDLIFGLIPGSTFGSIVGSIYC